MCTQKEWLISAHTSLFLTSCLTRHAIGCSLMQYKLELVYMPLFVTLPLTFSDVAVFREGSRDGLPEKSDEFHLGRKSKGD